MSTCGRAGPRLVDRGDLERVDALAQPGRHDLPDGGQRAGGGLLDARAGRGGDLERDGQRDGLVVVEQQRGQLASRVEPVPAVGALDGHDG